MIRKLPLVFFLAGVSTWQYITTSLAGCTGCLTFNTTILAGDVIGPAAYRPLTPALIVAMGNTYEALALFHFVMLVLFYALLWHWVNAWSSQGVAAVALAAVALSLMWPTYYGQSYTITEWVLWLAGLTLLTGRWSGWARRIGR